MSCKQLVGVLLVQLGSSCRALEEGPYCHTVIIRTAFALSAHWQDCLLTLPDFFRQPADTSPPHLHGFCSSVPTRLT